MVFICCSLQKFNQVLQHTRRYLMSHAADFRRFRFQPQRFKRFLRQNNAVGGNNVVICSLYEQNIRLGHNHIRIKIVGQH